jgi:P2-related tail formation protein
MSTTLRTSHLIDLCTPSISYDRQVQSACFACDQQMWEIIDDTGQVVMIPNIMGLTDEKLVDILAWQFHVDFYDKTQPLEFKKNLVQQSIVWHKTKGTVALVQWVLDTYFPGVCTLEEWYQYKVPLPPNYPVDGVDTLVKVFGPANVDVANDKFLFNAHGLTQNQQITFRIGSLAVSSRLPAPIVAGIYYYVANPTTNTFQVSPSPWQSGGAHMSGPSGAVVDLQDAGTGNNNECWRRGTGTWHDRYKFRVLVDSHFIDPDDQKTVLALIDRYKPVSRWLEGFVRATASQCDIGWTGMLLRFIYRTSEAPDYP